MKKINIYIPIACLLTLSGCASQKDRAIAYFAKNPQVFAEQAARQFPPKEVEKVKEILGPTIFVDCDSAVAANNPPQSQPDTPARSGNAPGNTKSGRRSLVPVQCPPSKEITKTIVDQAAVMNAEEKGRKAVEAAQNVAESWRVTAEVRSKEVATQMQRADTASKQRNWLAWIVGAYIVLRIAKGYLSKIPILGWLVKLII